MVLWLLFRLRMLGAGDIKLFAVIGGVTGTSVWSIMCYSFLAGGILAVIQMVYHRSLRNRIQYLLQYIQTCFIKKELISYESGFDTGNTKNTIHFSSAIIMGYVYWLLRR